MPRRRVLAWLSAGALLSVSGLTLVRTSGYAVAPELARRLRRLKAWQYVVIEAVGARIVAPERAAVGLYADAYLGSLAPADARDLLRFVAYVEHAAPLLAGYAHRFTRLDASAQDAVLSTLESSPSALLCAGFQALKALSFMELYRNPVSWRALGYTGQLI